MTKGLYRMRSSFDDRGEFCTSKHCFANRYSGRGRADHPLAAREHLVALRSAGIAGAEPGIDGTIHSRRWRSVPAALTNGTCCALMRHQSGQRSADGCFPELGLAILPRALNVRRNWPAAV